MRREGLNQHGQENLTFYEDLLGKAEVDSLRAALQLRASKKNPQVRRWQRVGMPRKAVPLAGLERLPLAMRKGAERLLAEVAQSRHTSALNSLAKVRIQVKPKTMWNRLAGALKLDTPLYDAKEREVRFNAAHFEPGYYQQYGDSPDLMLSHEMGHAWDFARGEAESGQAMKSYWASRVMPGILKATRGQIPAQFTDAKNNPRAAYMGLDWMEMPAILTELARHRPHEFEANRRLFQEDYGIDLKRVLNEFWGLDLGADADPQATQAHYERIARHKGKRVGRWGSQHGGRASYE